MNTPYIHEAGPRKSSVVSWILYDLANTIFALNISSLYFSLWIVNDLGGTDGQFGTATGISMAMVFITSPLLGALSDQARKRMPFLVATTVLCVFFTAFLGARTIPVALVVFIAANYFYQSGLIFYDALLPEVSNESNRGRIGGLGVGIGYLGSFIGVLVGALATARLGEKEGKPVIFQLTAVLFLLFALPCFLYVKETPRKARPFGLASLRGAFGELLNTARLARRYPGLPRFLVGRVFYTDATNTLGVFMGVYVTNELGFTLGEAQLVLISGIAAAVVGALIWGVIVDRVGPKKTLDVVLVTWTFTLLFAASIAEFSLPRELFWIVAPLAGICLGGTWTSDRPLMLRLSPPRYLGLFYGLYNMVGRFSAIIGPFLWTFFVDVAGIGRTAAVASLAVMMVIGFLIIRPVSDTRRSWEPEDLPELEVETKPA